MGQRFQIIIKTPAIYMNKNNPNNDSGAFLAFHQQWMYGADAIRRSSLFIEKLGEALKKYKDVWLKDHSKQQFINHGLHKTLCTVMQRLCHNDIYKNHTYHTPATYHIYNEKQKNISIYNEEDKLSYEPPTLRNVMDRCENNNGYLYIEINKDLEFEYTFISGLEDSEKEVQVTPMQYLKLFYENEEELSEAVMYLHKELGILQEYKQFPPDYVL